MKIKNERQAIFYFLFLSKRQATSDRGSQGIDLDWKKKNYFIGLKKMETDVKPFPFEIRSKIKMGALQLGFLS